MRLRRCSLVALLSTLLLATAGGATSSALPSDPSSSASLSSSSASTAASWFGPSTISAAPAWTACTLKLDGIRTPITASQHTVTVVKQTSKTHARLSFYRRVEGACAVKREFRTRTARLGYGGTVQGTERKQGTGTTPRGTYSMTEAFGNGSAPTTAMPFHEVSKGDYWVQDNDSDYYNLLRNKADGGFRTRSSENLRGFGKQYRYVVVINFNRAPDFQQRHRGSGIFLHVKTAGATAGCIAATKHQLQVVVRYLQPGDTITIGR